jgi:hypothetical protein
MGRKLAALAALAAAFAGVMFVLRARGRRRERVELFYEDGSLVTLMDDDAKPLVDIARSALDAART